MPRPSPQYHPCQDIRAVLGEAEGRSKPITQERFGELLPENGKPRAGVSIRKVEAGELALSPKLAAQITALTGVDTRPILQGKRGTPLTLDGRPFTIEALRQWQGKRFDDGDVERMSGALSDAVRGVLDTLAKDPARLRLAYCLISETLGSIAGGLAQSTGASAFPGIEELHDLIKPDTPARRRDSWETIIDKLGRLPDTKTAGRAQASKKPARR